MKKRQTFEEFWQKELAESIQLFHADRIFRAAMEKTWNAAYEEGYEDGVGAANGYDPGWDIT